MDWKTIYLFITIFCYIPEIASDLPCLASINSCLSDFNLGLNSSVGVNDFKAQFVEIAKILNVPSRTWTELCPAIIKYMDCIEQLTCFYIQSSLSGIYDYLLYACAIDPAGAQSISRCYNCSQGSVYNIVSNCAQKKDCLSLQTEYDCIYQAVQNYTCLSSNVLLEYYNVLTQPREYLCKIVYQNETIRQQQCYLSSSCTFNLRTFSINLLKPLSSSDIANDCNNAINLSCYNIQNCYVNSTYNMINFQRFNQSMDYVCNQNRNAFISYQNCFSDARFQPTIANCTKQGFPKTFALEAYRGVYAGRLNCINSKIASIGCSDPALATTYFQKVYSPYIDLLLPYNGASNQRSIVTKWLLSILHFGALGQMYRSMF